MDIMIRKMTAADLRQVVSIEGASFSDPWSRSMLADELCRPRSWHRVAETSGGQVVGYLIGRTYPVEWHLLDIAVAPSTRRRGVGAALLDEFLIAADSERVSVVLEVRLGNDEARALYEGLGFRAVGVRPQYYHDTLEDALVMEHLPDSRACAPEKLSGPLLAIETSCDDSSAAVLTPDGTVLANVVHCQDAIHERYGGVVPEVASRAHVERLSAVVSEALRQAGCSVDGLGAVAATVGPGLIGALLVGVTTAKAIAWSHKLPFLPVNHVHGHLAAVWLADREVPFPMVTLVASGGHTALIRVDGRSTFTLLGQTLDDAAGEAFDKGARLLGLGYPGGRELDELAEAGDPEAFSFPIALQRSPAPDFSFSGVKTALYYLLRDMTPEERKARAADVAASYREAIVSALLLKTLKTAKKEGARTVAVAGGVAANSLLRRRLVAEGRQAGFHVVVPPFSYCTDNAAMVGAAALAGPCIEYPEYLEIDATASLALGRWLPGE
jgi:N6-L-threonylcarbamoyladenine synthase